MSDISIEEEEFEEIYNIIMMFSKISREYFGQQYFYLRRSSAKENKNYKYFKGIYDKVLAGEIFLPDFFIAQFESSLWGKKKKIYPRQLLSDRAMKVWEKRKRKIGVKESHFDREDLVELVLDKIHRDLSDDNFMNNFIVGNSISAKLYFEWKKEVGESYFNLIFSVPLSMWKKKIKESLVMEISSSKEYFRDIDLLDIPEREKSIKKRMRKNKGKYFKALLDGLILLISRKA